MKKIEAFAIKRDLDLLKDCPWGISIYHSKEMLANENDPNYLKGTGIVKILIEII